MKKKRNSSIELLRIIAAMSVVIVHYNWNIAFREEVGGENQILLHFADSLAIPAVDIFMVISGFFSCMSYKRTIGKPFNLLFQVIFWHILFYIIGCIQGSRVLCLHDLFFSFIYPDYFVTLYVVVYVFSPYINLLIDRLTIRDFRFFLFFCILVFSVWAFSVDVILRDFTTNLNNASPVGIGGGHGGCSFVNFCLAYLIGAYIRKADVCLCWKKALGGFVACAVILCAWRYFELSVGINNTILTARSYHNPFVLAQAALALLFVRNFKFQNSIVNKIAGAAFTCYMIQGFFLGMAGIQQAVCSSAWYLVFHLLFTMLWIYMVSFMLDRIYKYLFSHIFEKMDVYSIPYRK